VVRQLADAKSEGGAAALREDRARAQTERQATEGYRFDNVVPKAVVR
jgi:hypothetical protein